MIQPVPSARMRRMRRMFDKTGGILVEDYEYFTKLDAASLPNKAPHKSAKGHERPSPKPN